MDMGEYFRREPNAKMIKLEKNEGTESVDSWKCQPHTQTTWQNSIKLEEESIPYSEYEFLSSNETRLLNPFYSNNPHERDQKLFGFNCHKCSKYFTTPQEITRHWAQIHGLHPVHCQVCDDPFPSNDDMWDHKMAIHGIPCKLCDAFFKSQEMLVAHAKSVHLNDSFSESNQVKEEREVDNSDNKEMKPSASHSSTTTFPEVQNKSSAGFKCHQCPQQFITPELLKCHLLGKHGLNPGDYKPSMSSMSHTQNNTFPVVEGTVSSGFKCQKCPQYFLTPELLKCHFLGKHELDSGDCKSSMSSVPLTQNNTFPVVQGTVSFRFKCRKCPQHFLTRDLLKCHWLGKHGLDPVDCIVCKESFPTMAELLAHKTAHGIRCKICSSVFDTEINLNSHIKVRHPDYYSYKCEFCKMGFDTENFLNGHLVNYHREMATRRKCNFCSFVPISEEDLEVHMAIHTFPYNCSVCGMRLNCNTTYKNHKRDTLHEIGAGELGLIPPGNTKGNVQKDREDFSCDDVPGMSSTSTSSNAAKNLEMKPLTSQSQSSSSTTIPNVQEYYDPTSATFKCHLCHVMYGGS